MTTDPAVMAEAGMLQDSPAVDLLWIVASICFLVVFSLFIVLIVVFARSSRSRCILHTSAYISMYICIYIWRAPWKNRISSTTMKLRKSLVKPVTQQNISSCSVLPPKIVMHDAFNVILWTFADICIVVHDDLWKNQTTRCNRFWRAGCSRLEYIDIRLVY